MFFLWQSPPVAAIVAVVTAYGLRFFSRRVILAASRDAANRVTQHIIRRPDDENDVPPFRRK